MASGNQTHTNHSAPVLLAVFGSLIALIAISDLEAINRARSTYRALSALNERYRHTEGVLNSIGSGMYTVGLLARDYLLDPSNARAAEYRNQLVAERSAMQQEFLDLSSAVRAEDKPRLDALHSEVEGYWDALAPLFDWTPEQKSLRSWGFLRREVLPRRRAALRITSEISGLTQANLAQERREVDRNQSAMPVFFARMLGATVLVAFGIAALTIFRIARLERHSEQQRARAERAETELRLLSRQLVHAQEEERKSISRELHDEVGQMLTALRMELRSLQDLRCAPETQFEGRIDSARRLAEQSLRSLRDLAMGLRPSMLDDIGLGSALQWQARQFAKHAGVPVNVEIARMPSSLPEAYRTCIYRVVQEALTNCARHAKAKSIHIGVSRGPEAVTVSVRDDGIGFDQSNVRGRGLGLIGMQERVKGLGGVLIISAKPGNGTVLSARLPWAEEAASLEHSHSVGR